jgi:hypothetical protein
MDFDPLQLNILQPALFDLDEASLGSIELFPAVWGAAESCAHPEPQVRAEGLQRLEALGAARFSPLVAYLLSTRLVEPDTALREKVVRLLASVLRPDANGTTAPPAVRQTLRYALSQMRTRSIFALLELAERFPHRLNDSALLLSSCSYAGVHLGAILGDRSVNLPIRILAARMIGMVGYLDALPQLERMAARLQVRLAGQQAMPFAPVDEQDEVALLPAVQEALALLREP